MKWYWAFGALGAATLIGCASEQKHVVEQAVEDHRPAWVSSSKIGWADGDQLFYRGKYSILGTERVSGCYQLARLESKEALLREISEEIRGQIDNANQSISEDAEVVLAQSRSSEYGGKVTGFRFNEEFHERYNVNGTERVDCYVLGSVSKSDYENIRRSIVFKMAAVDPDLKKAIQKRQIDFFSPRSIAGAVVSAASTAAGAPALGAAAAGAAASALATESVRTPDATSDTADSGSVVPTRDNGGRSDERSSRRGQ